MGALVGLGLNQRRFGASQAIISHYRANPNEPEWNQASWWLRVRARQHMRRILRSKQPRRRVAFERRGFLPWAPFAACVAANTQRLLRGAVGARQTRRAQ